MIKKKKKVFVGAICGDGMCPYVPCVNYPDCKHVEEIENEDNEIGQYYEDMDRLEEEEFEKWK